MILLFDNLVNNYINIISCLIILYVFYLNKYSFLNLFIIDTILNMIPYISIIILILFYLNKFIFKRLINNNINKFVLSILYYFIFISLLYLLNNYNFNYLYYIVSNLFSIILNIIIYFIFIFYKNS